MELDEEKAENSEYIKLSFTLPDPTTTSYAISMIMLKVQDGTSAFTFSSTSGSLETEESDPLDEKFLWADPADVYSDTSVVAGTTYSDWKQILNFKYLSTYFTVDIGTATDVTFSIELRTPNGDIYDISEDYLGDASGLSFTADGGSTVIDTEGIGRSLYEYRYKVVVTGGTADEITIETKGDTL